MILKTPNLQDKSNSDLDNKIDMQELGVKFKYVYFCRKHKTTTFNFFPSAFFSTTLMVRRLFLWFGRPRILPFL